MSSFKRSGTPLSIGDSTRGAFPAAPAVSLYLRLLFRADTRILQMKRKFPIK